MYIQNERLSTQYSAQLCDGLPREVISPNYRELSSAAVKSSASTGLENTLV